MFRFLFFVIVVAAGAAYLTKPTQADAENLMREQALALVAKEEVGGDRSTGENLALTLCKLKPNDCYELVRSGIETQVTDRTFFIEIALQGFERKVTCYGAFTTFVCPGGVQRDR